MRTTQSAFIQKAKGQSPSARNHQWFFLEILREERIFSERGVSVWKKQRKSRTALLGFVNAGVYKFLRKSFRDSSKTQIVSMRQVTWVVNEGIILPHRLYLAAVSPRIYYPAEVNPPWYKAALLAASLVPYRVFQEKSRAKSYKTWVGLRLPQAGCGISIPGNVQKANGQGSEQARVTSKSAVLWVGEGKDDLKNTFPI